MHDWFLPQALEAAHCLPAELYTGADWAALETARIHRRSWQLLARSADLRQPGDLVVAEISGLPLLLLRDQDDELRALHNVCRHRGGPLASACAQGVRQLRCQYHGWTYDLDGSLRSGPELAAISGLDPASVRLPSAAVAQWQGLVFAALEPAQPFAELVAGIDQRLAGADLSGYCFQRRMVYEANCNWKAYIDNYLEGYHLPHVHPALNRLLDYRRYRTECAPWYSLQSSPLDPDAGNFYGAGEALYYFLWPATMLNILPGRLQTNRVIPLAPDRCRIEFDYYYAPGVAGREADTIAADQALADQTQHEDIAIVQSVQRAYASGSFHQGRVHPIRETGIHHFQELYRAAMR